MVLSTCWLNSMWLKVKFILSFDVSSEYLCLGFTELKMNNISFDFLLVYCYQPWWSILYFHLFFYRFSISVTSICMHQIIFKGFLTRLEQFIVFRLLVKQLTWLTQNEVFEVCLHTEAHSCKSLMKHAQHNCDQQQKLRNN